MSNRPQPNHVCQPLGRRKTRRGVVLAVVLAGMVLLLLMLGGLARRVMIEHRAIDARAQSLQADWLLWSAAQRARTPLQGSSAAPGEWNFAPRNPTLGKKVSSRVLELAPPMESDAHLRSLELRWTTSSGVIVERSEVIKIPATSTTEGAP